MGWVGAVKSLLEIFCLAYAATFLIGFLTGFIQQFWTLWASLDHLRAEASAEGRRRVGVPGSEDL